MTDETRDLARTGRRGLLSELGERQLDVREILATARSSSDKTLLDGLVGNLGYPDEAITAIVLARHEMLKDEREITPQDLIWAGELLDHLDTLGLELRRKNGRRFRQS